MIDITITNMWDAMKRAQETPYTKIVSLVDNNSPVKSIGENHLVLTVADLVEMPERFKGEYVNPKVKPVLPAPEHVDIVLAHTADMKDGDSLLIHCAAGKSRSPAMAIAILIQHGMSWQAAFDHIFEMRPQMIPNQLMMSFIDAKFGFNGEFFKFYTDWYMERIKQVALF